MLNDMMTLQLLSQTLMTKMNSVIYTEEVVRSYH